MKEGLKGMSLPITCNKHYTIIYIVFIIFISCTVFVEVGCNKE